MIVQVAKDPIGTKGARITSHISIPGRHLVFMPTVDHVGISRRIERDGERRRLRELVDRMRPEGTGFIVRTVADGVEGQKLEADIRFLIQVWNEIIRTKDKVGAPALHPPRPRPHPARHPRPLHLRRPQAGHRRPRRVRAHPALRPRAGPAPRVADRALRRAGADLRRLRHRAGAEAGRAAQGLAEERRLHHHRPGRGAHRHRRQLGALRRQEEPRGDHHQDQRRGGQGDRLPAPAAQHRRHHHHRLHRHGQTPEPGQGLQVPPGRPGARQGQDQRPQDLGAGARGDDAQAGARVDHPHDHRVVQLLRRQGAHPLPRHRGLRDLPGDPARLAELPRARARGELSSRGGPHRPGRRAGRAPLPDGSLQQDHPGEAADRLPPGAVRHLRPTGAGRRWRRERAPRGGREPAATGGSRGW